MKAEQLERILETVQGARKEGSVHMFPDDSDLSVFISLPAEVIAVAKVVRYERSADVAVLETQQGDRFHVTVESIAMVKQLAAAKRTGGRSAGFR